MKKRMRRLTVDAELDSVSSDLGQQQQLPSPRNSLVRSTTKLSNLAVAVSAAIVIMFAASACGSGAESAEAPTSPEAGVETGSAAEAGGFSDGEEAYVATVRARIAPLVFHAPDQSLLSHGRRACGEFDEATESGVTTQNFADSLALTVIAFEEAEAAALYITINEAVSFLCDEHQETWYEIQDLLGINADAIAMPLTTGTVIADTALTPGGVDHLDDWRSTASAIVLLASNRAAFSIATAA